MQHTLPTYTAKRANPYPATHHGVYQRQAIKQAAAMLAPLVGIAYAALTAAALVTYITLHTAALG